MATFTKTIPTDLVNEVVEAYCFAYNYQTEIDGLPNPETKVQFAKRIDREYTVNLVKQYRVSVLETQRQTLNEQADIDCQTITVE